MRLFDLIALLAPDIRPGNSKVHLATSDGEKNPLDVYLEGRFDEWQRWQSRRNFGRDYVVALIALPQTHRWLFAGAYRSHGAEARRNENGTAYFWYELERLPGCDELAGRLVLTHARKSRQSYLNAEKQADEIVLAEIYAEPLSVGEFPGYRAVHLSHGELELIFRLTPDSWRTALSSVAGIYLISDTVSGRLYVGSAYGEGGFWQRWASYAATGDGGNVELRNLLKAEGRGRVNAFRYSILEIADTHTGKDDILAREAHWKSVLLTRSHGLNAN